MPDINLPRLLAIVFLATALPGLTVAAPPQSAGNAKLRDTRWVVQAMDGAPSTRADQQAAVHVVLHAASQQLSGFGGCNAVRGRYVQRGTQLVLSARGSNRKVCAPDVMQQERRLIELLGAVDSYRIEGQELSLLQGDAVRASLRAHRSK